MASTLHVDIVSAEHEIYSGDAEMVFAPLTTGEVGVLPGHTPLLGRMKAGEVRVRSDNEEHHFYVSGGLLEIQPHIVTILADTALRARDLDEAAALQAVQSAERTLKDQQAGIDYAKVQAELAEAMARLRVIRRFRERGVK